MVQFGRNSLQSTYLAKELLMIRQTYKTHQIIFFNYVPLIVYQLYLNKIFSLKKTATFNFISTNTISYD